MNNRLKYLGVILTAAFVLAACRLTPSTIPTQGDEPYKITGGFTVTNDFVIATYMVEQAVALVDMHGFVIRDQWWEIPVEGQVLGFLSVDVPNLSGSYELSLPAHPEGVPNDVDNNGQTDAGVQIFSVAYWPNLAGGPYSEGDDKSFGWPSYLASIKTDAGNQYEVTGGKLVVWAADAGQSFPTDFGADGKLFTSDDPVAALPAGYSVVDLDQSPFAFSQEKEPQITLYEPTETALKDYSSLSYLEAYDTMYEFVSVHYAFNGIQGKPPDWEALNAEIRPRVEQAQANSDAMAYYLALRDFTWAFKDGHVGLDGGEPGAQAFADANAGGYGFAMRELDDGRFVVLYVRDPGPALAAGMEVGAVITKFNDQPISQAVSENKPWTLPSSTEWNTRYQQARYLLSVPVGTEATVTFTNPGGTSKTATLKAIAENDSRARTSVYYGVDVNPLLPVEFRILDSGVGYVAVNSYYDDLNLIIRLFKRALDSFTANSVPGIIIDLRYNSGGNPLGLAGFLTNQEIPLAQGYSYSETTGKFEKDGVPGKLIPNVEQYSFDKMVLLTGPACVSACDQEAYAFSKVPGMIVVGMFPTSGTFADVADGQIALPEGFSMQISTERFELPDGSLFLEGSGIAPTVLVPQTEETVMTTNDVVLQFAENAVLLPAGAGLIPSSSPKLATDQPAAEIKLTGSATFLEDKARESYDSAQLSQPGVFTYTIPLSASEELAWVYGWCATPDKFDQNWQHIATRFVLNGLEVPADQLFKYEFTASGQKCRYFYTLLSDWAAGEHHLNTTATFDASINDGSADYPAGTYISDYTVFVRP